MEDYYTVTEYAEVMGKDPGNIRRLLAYGRLIGEKKGRQWLIPKDAVYPEDGRLRSGNYRNWRRRPEIWHSHPQLIRSLLQMSAKLSIVYKESLVKVILYGSYARGEETDESDVDIALLLRSGSTAAMHDAMTDIVVECEMEQGVTLSVLPIEYDQYEDWGKTLPFYKNLDREGIILWKTA